MCEHKSRWWATSNHYSDHSHHTQVFWRLEIWPVCVRLLNIDRLHVPALDGGPVVAPGEVVRQLHRVYCLPVHLQHHQQSSGSWMANMSNSPKVNRCTLYHKPGLCIYRNQIGTQDWFAVILKVMWVNLKKKNHLLIRVVQELSTSPPGEAGRRHSWF